MNFETPFNRPIKSNTKFVVGFKKSCEVFYVTSQHSSEKAAAKMAAWDRKNCANGSAREVRAI